MLFHYHPIRVDPSTQEAIINEGLRDFEVQLSPSFALDPPL
jgi:hypothetical protein